MVVVGGGGGGVCDYIKEIWQLKALGGVCRKGMGRTLLNTCTDKNSILCHYIHSDTF